MVARPAVVALVPARTGPAMAFGAWTLAARGTATVLSARAWSGLSWSGWATRTPTWTAIPSAGMVEAAGAASRA